jgi:hypothetical protein
VELPAKASVHINMQQAFTERGAELDTLKARAFGGFFIRAESPTAKILLKEHIFSQSRQVASPYYGSADQLISHEICNQPQWLTVGNHGWADAETCYQSGCLVNHVGLNSQQPSILSVVWDGFVSRPRVTGQQPGHATLYSQVTGPGEFHGTQVTLHAFAGVSVYDATPVISAIVPNTIPAGGSVDAEIYGSNFGTNPTFSATGGITITPWYWSPNQINATFSAPATPPGTYSVTVTSNGVGGVFLQAPGGGSQAQSAPKPVGVFGATSATLSPSQLLLSTGDSHRTLSLSVAPSSLQYTAVYSSSRPAGQQPPGQTCAATLNIPNVSGTGTTNASVSASPTNCSGVFGTFATAAGKSSSSSQIVVPPQPLIRVLYREALAYQQQPELDPNGIAQKSIGWCMRNRFGDSVYFSGQNTYQAIMDSGQVANSPITHGPDTTLANAASVFLGSGADPTGGSSCFWSPTDTEYTAALGALSAGVVAFPPGIGAPSCFPSSIRQAVIKMGMPNNTQAGSTGAPAFMFLRTRSSGAPAVVQIP